MPTEVGGGMELSGNLAGFLFVLQEPYLENDIFWRRCIYGQAAESVDMRLDFPGRCFTEKSYSSRAADQQ